MIIAPTHALPVAESTRLDAKYHTAPAIRIRTALSRTKKLTLREIGSYGEVYAPNRFKRTYASPGEKYISYLRPYDVFEYLPPEADRLSVARTENLADYKIMAGELLQTCSGRNLGPLTIVDDYLARFVLSHDMIRIRIPDETERFYTLAVLQSSIGQHLLRGDLNGSVIDHITDFQVASLRLPFIHSITEKVVSLMREATSSRSKSRITLRNAVVGLNTAIAIKRGEPLREGWIIKAAALGTRLDAAYHSTSVRSIKKKLLDMGGVTLGSVATVTKPGGRYKTYYVTPGNGTPLLSGTQILQADPIAPKHISARSIADGTRYKLKSGSVCFQADGRAEESLGYPAMVTRERDGWLASGHVGRAVPDSDDDAGWLWAAMASDAVQEQIAALACGSVVDALYPEDLNSVVLPPRDLVDSEAIALAWRDFADSGEKAAAARCLVEIELSNHGIRV